MYYYSECATIKDFESGSVTYPYGRQIKGAAMYTCDSSMGYYTPEDITPIQICTENGWSGNVGDIYCVSKFFCVPVQYFT